MSASGAPLYLRIRTPANQNHTHSRYYARCTPRVYISICTPQYISIYILHVYRFCAIHCATDILCVGVCANYNISHCVQSATSACGKIVAAGEDGNAKIRNRHMTRLLFVYGVCARPPHFRVLQRELLSAS